MALPPNAPTWARTMAFTSDTKLCIKPHGPPIYKTKDANKEMLEKH